MQPDVKTSQILSYVAIVTGGGRGLGRAMVLGLTQAGIHVVATAARERTEIEAVAEEVRQSCGESRVLPLLADVTHDDGCARVVDVALERFGRLDILVNNAGRGMKYVSNEFLTEPTRRSGRARDFERAGKQKGRSLRSCRKTGSDIGDGAYGIRKA